MAGPVAIRVRIMVLRKKSPPPPPAGGGWGEGNAVRSPAWYLSDRSVLRWGDPSPPTPSRKGRGRMTLRPALILTRRSRNQEACYNPSPEDGVLRGTPWGSH